MLNWLGAVHFMVKGAFNFSELLRGTSHYDQRSRVVDFKTQEFWLFNPSHLEGREQRPSPSTKLPTWWWTLEGNLDHQEMEIGSISFFLFHFFHLYPSYSLFDDESMCSHCFFKVVFDSFYLLLEEMDTWARLHGENFRNWIN